MFSGVFQKVTLLAGDLRTSRIIHGPGWKKQQHVWCGAGQERWSQTEVEMPTKLSVRAFGSTKALAFLGWWMTLSNNTDSLPLPALLHQSKIALPYGLKGSVALFSDHSCFKNLFFFLPCPGDQGFAMVAHEGCLTSTIRHLGTGVSLWADNGWISDSSLVLITLLVLSTE